MAGAKGKSGRRSNRDEEQRLRVLQMAWDLAEEDLKNPDLDRAIKRELYTKLIIKDMPTELSGGFTATVVAMGTIQKGNESPLEFKIGTPHTSENTEHTKQAPPTDPQV